MTALPIEEVLAELLAALRAAGSAVLVAPPGAGKTTRVPPALLAGGLAGSGEVVVLEPRRLAARLAARRVAEERGERVGETVGYQVRFDSQVGPTTRIRFVTEGVLGRQLVADPRLERVGAVVLDEFHERHLAGDTALALLARLQRGVRPDLRIVVMSATLDPGPLSAYLGGCPVVSSRGRQHPVEVCYRGPDSLGRAARDWPLEKQLAAAVRDAAGRAPRGHILCFLPGAAEIRRASAACAELAAHLDCELLPLHGALSAEEQDRAVAPATRRKILLATNVAETSVTIEGVSCVVDSGLARMAVHSPWTGLAALVTRPVSQASAEQRAGRAGRTGPGLCVRLYTQHDFATRPAFDPPEIQRAELAEVALELHAAGVADLAGFPWFEPPPAEALRAAEELLQRLGAIDRAGALTSTGQRMLRFPVHPRQARVLVEGERRGVARRACDVAALLATPGLERSDAGLRGPREARVSGDSDLLLDLERLHEARAVRFSRTALRVAGIDAAAAQLVDRTAAQLARLVSAGGPAPASETARDEALCIAILTGYPDRVAARRTPGAPELLFAAGGGGVQARSSAVQDSRLLVAVEAQDGTRERGRGPVVHRASAVRAEWLLDLYIERVRESDELVWNADAERVERVERLWYEQLVLDESRDLAGARARAEDAAAILARAALVAGVDRFYPAEELARWRGRLAFAARIAPDAGLPGLDDATLAAGLTALCAGRTSFAELRATALEQLIGQLLTPAQRAQLERLAPLTVPLGKRPRVAVHYELDREPWIASRLQDFFGMARGPAVAAGRVPLVLHLLAPNQRAVQITQDLAGFWERHYPALRKQLMRRYPRHAWPEDPLHA